MSQGLLISDRESMGVPSRQSSVQVPNRKFANLSEVVTGNDLFEYSPKVVVEEIETFTNGDSIEFSLEDATTKAVYVNSDLLYTNAGATANSDVDFSTLTEDSFYISYFNFDSGVFLPDVSNEKSFFNYGYFSYTSGNKGNQDTMYGWNIEENSNPTSVSVNTTATTIGTDPSQRDLVIDINNTTTDTYTDRIFSDQFVIYNYQYNLKLHFDYDISTPTGGTLDELKFVISGPMNVESNKNGLVTVYQEIDLTPGSGSIDVDIDSSVFNKTVNFAFVVKYTGSGSFTIRITNLKVYDSTYGTVKTLYSLNKGILKSGETSAIDLSSITLDDMGLTSVKFFDPDSVLVASYKVIFSKDGVNWFYFRNGEWLYVTPGSEFTIDAPSTDYVANDMTMDDFEFLLKNNTTNKIYWALISDEVSFPAGMIVSSVRADFESRNVYAPNANSFDVSITPYRKVVVTNNTGSDVSNVVIKVMYV